jgi:hypothetical protein
MPMPGLLLLLALRAWLLSATNTKDDPHFDDAGIHSLWDSESKSDSGQQQHVGPDESQPAENQVVSPDRPPAPEKERILVVIIGGVRAPSAVHATFVQHVLQPLNADLALLVGNSTPTALHRRAKFLWTVPEYEDWSVVLDEAARMLGVPTSAEQGGWRVLGETHNCGRQFLGGVRFGGDSKCEHKGTGGILLAMRWLLQQRLVEHQVLEKYDRLLITRSDYMYLCDYPSPPSFLDSRFAWLPCGQDWDGITDRQLLVPAAQAMRFLNVTQQLLCDPTAVPRFTENLEQIIKVFWERANLTQGIRRFMHPGFTVQSNRTGEDRSNHDWRPAASEEEDRVFTPQPLRELGLSVKYAQELHVFAKPACSYWAQLLRTPGVVPEAPSWPMCPGWRPGDN